ncbi:MAG: glycosyltransferase family 39 protein [Anaerolineae bacterium]
MSGDRPWLSWLLLLALLAVALALRWRYVQEISLFVDEFVTAWAARMVPRTGLPIFPSGNIYPHGLLFTYLEVPFVLGAFDETLARTPALIVSLATLPVAYLVGRRMLSEEAGLAAAAAMAVDPAFIVWGGRARMYGLLQLLALLAIYVYYRGLAEDRPGLRYGAMGLLVAGIFTHAEAAFLLPALGLATLVVVPWRRLWRRDVIGPFIVGGAGVLAFFLLAKYGQPGHLETLEQEGRSYLALTAGILSGPRAFAPVFVAPHRLAFSMLALTGLIYIVRPRFERRSALTYLYVILVSFVGGLVVLAGATWERERYLFLILPLLFLVGSEVARRLLALVRISPQLRRWQPAALAALAALYVGLLGAPRAYTDEWGYDLAFRYLQDHFDSEAGDRLATSMSTAAMLYLGRNDAFVIQRGYEEYVVEPEGNAEPQAVDLWTATPVLTTTTEFVDILEEGPVVWFVVDGWRLQTRYEPDFILTVLAQMDLVYEERGVLVFRGEGYAPLPEPAFERAVGVEFDHALALERFGLSDLAAEPGDALRVTLHWRALEEAGPAYTTFLHLIAPDGSGMGGVDEPILRGVYQPDLWPEGAVLPDHHTLTIPADLPPGRYRLDAGLYPSDEPGQVLSTGSADRVPLAAIQVGTAGEPVPTVCQRDSAFATFGDEIELAGHDLARQGDAVQLDLCWRALGPVSRDYTVFVHLVNPAGGIVDQDDHPPGDAFFPTSTWLPDYNMLDAHSVTLPSGHPGDYRLLVGLYDPRTEERLPATDAPGEPVGDSIVVSLDTAGGTSP